MDDDTKNKVDRIISELNYLKVNNPSAADAALMACLSVILAEEQEKAAIKMEKQTDRLVGQTHILVSFTKGLYWLTAALLFLGIVQLVVAFVCRR